MDSQTSKTQALYQQNLKSTITNCATNVISSSKLKDSLFIDSLLDRLASGAEVDAAFFCFSPAQSLDDSFWFKEEKDPKNSHIRRLPDQVDLLSYFENNGMLSVSSTNSIPDQLHQLKEQLRFQKVNNLSIIPIKSSKELYGILTLISYNQNSVDWTPEIYGLWEFLGHVIGSSLARVATLSAYQENLARYETLIDGMEEGIILCDNNGYIVHTNRRLNEMLGYTTDELTNNLSYSLVHPEDEEKVRTRSAERLDHKSDRYEVKLSRKNGGYIWTSISATPWLDQNSTVIGSLAAVTDITEQKRSQDAIQLMLETTAGTTEGDFFKALTRNLAKIFQSKYAFISSLVPDETVWCKTITVWRDRKFIDNAEYNINDSPTEYVLKNGFSVFKDDVTKKFPKDTYLKQENIVSYIGTPLISSHGEPLGILGIMSDKPLADWKTGEQIVKIFAHRASAELERLNSSQETEILQQQLIQVQKMEAIGTLASGLAHDINNSMGVLTGHLELIQKRCKSKSQLSQQELEKVLSSTVAAQKASTQAQQVVNQLLNFAKPKLFEPSTVCIQTLVEETIQLFSNKSIEPSEIRIIDTREKYFISGDKSQLQQVVTNMFLNALTAMPCGGVITVSYFTTYVNKPSIRNLNASPGIYVQLAISDTGAGIPREYLDKVFEPFFSTHSTSANSGLGLSMAYTIIQQHQGWIDVDSQVGKGSTFTLYLPLRATDETKENADHSVQECKSNRYVMVIDDEASVMDLTVQFLERNNYNTQGFIDPHAAVEWFKTNHQQVSAIVLDLKMPTMDGKDCLVKLKKIDPNIEVIVLSGEVENSIQETLLDLGAARFFSKPVEYKELIDWLDLNIE